MYVRRCAQSSHLTALQVPRDPFAQPGEFIYALKHYQVGRFVDP
jgi:hypothetical protein